MELKSTQGISVSIQVKAIGTYWINIITDTILIIKASYVEKWSFNLDSSNFFNESLYRNRNYKFKINFCSFWTIILKISGKISPYIPYSVLNVIIFPEKNFSPIPITAYRTGQKLCFLVSLKNKK